LKKIFLIVIGGVIFLVAAYVLGLEVFRAQLESDLTRACQRPVKVKAVNVVFPIGIVLKGLEVPPVGIEKQSPLSAQSIQIQLVPVSAVFGKPALAVRVDGLHFTCAWNWQMREILRRGNFQARLRIPAQVSSLNIAKGRIVVVDEDITPAFPWIFQNLSVDISAKTQDSYTFRCSSELVDEKATPIGSLQADGHFVVGGPVDGKLVFQHAKIEALSPYVRRLLGTTLLKGAVELSSSFTLHEGLLISQNDLTATGLRFASGKIAFMDMEPDRVVDLLTDPNGEIHLSFRVAGSLKEKLDWSDLAASAMREALHQAMARSIKRTLEAAQQGLLEERLRRQLESIER